MHCLCTVLLVGFRHKKRISKVYGLCYIMMATCKLKDDIHVGHLRSKRHVMAGISAVPAALTKLHAVFNDLRKRTVWANAVKHCKIICNM